MASEFLIIDLPTPANQDFDQAVVAARQWVDRTYNNIQNSVGVLEPKAFVFRLDPNKSWLLSENDEVHLLAELRAALELRFDLANSELFILYSDFYEIKIVGDSDKAKDHSALITEIRAFELSELAFRSGALYHQFGAHLFEHPSGEVSDFFFRAGNVQANFNDLQTLWFWTIPHLKNVKTIVCDTWSISTFGAYIALRIQDYDGTAAPVDWRYLRGYIGDDVVLNNDLEEAFKVTETEAQKLLFLLSASASGRSYRSITEIASAEGVHDKRFSILTLFALSEAARSEPHLCDISGHLTDVGLEGFGCQENLDASSIKYNIDSRTYFPSYAVDTKHVFIPATTAENSHTKQSKNFFEEYAGHGLFSVCRDGDSNSSLNKPRHHAFHVDVEQLFHQSTFQTKLNTVLSDLPKVTHLFHNSKAADKYIAELAIQQLGHEVEVIELSSFRDIRDNETFFELLTLSDSCILILDSQAISGSSGLAEFQRSLRDLFNDMEFSPSRITCRINYVVGLVRFDSEEDLRNTTRYFPQSAPNSKNYLKFNSIEQVVLPDWDETQCPWCREKRILRAVINEHKEQMPGRERYHIDKRLEALSRTRGLQSGVFSKRYGSDNFDFHPGSFFLDKLQLPDNLVLSEADLTCAVASALQSWRASTESKAPANYVIPNDVVFSPNMYNETALRAAIWRSLRPREIAIRNSSESTVARNLLKGIFNSAELSKSKNREGDFVLGLEAALAFGKKVKMLIGDDHFDEIDWMFLQHVAEKVRPSK